jgi:ATP-dependent DNA helicase RecG
VPVSKGFAGQEAPTGWPRLPGTPRPESAERSVSALPGVGPALEKKLGKLGLRAVRDLIEYRPHRYEAAVPERRIADLLAGEEATIAGEVRGVSVRRPRRNLAIVQARVSDESDEITAVWFNQAWLAERLQPGTRVRLRGQLKRNGFQVRSYDLNGVSATADFAPVYPASEEVTPKRLRALVERALRHARDLPDPLPASLKAAERLPLRADALVALHRPRSLEEGEEARRRLAFDELLVLQVGLAQARAGREAAVAPPLGEPGELIARYRELLPFELTPDQQQAIAEIDRDLARERPMQRLLQGDVGSGKTVVALYALLRGVEAGLRGALMAPTETLAEQHFLTIEPLCAELGVPVALLTGSVKSDVDAARIVVGTHALIQEGVDLGELGVAVVDEQHRFGVEQRRALTSGVPSAGVNASRAKPATLSSGAASGASGVEQRRALTSGVPSAGVNASRAKPATLSSGAASGASGVEQRRALVEGRAPHVLHLTATPIPRTLALTLYGDLQVTEIAKPPASRKPIVTSWVTAERSSAAYTRLRKHLDAGRQAYVVCPLIAESETSQARAAEVEAERLRRAELREYRVGLLHGRLRPGERRELMARFKARELDVLVATTVIEVGVDVPNATIMIVQEADRFGLAQLHQLRGRVGRGAEQSYCLLISRPREELTDNAQERLQALVDSTDGFELAEKDLELRGEGQLLGTRQSGLSDLRFVHWRADRPLLERARAAAEELVEYEGPLVDEIERLFGERELAA